MRDVRGIALASVSLAAYETYALTRKKPTITDLSHRWPFSFLVWSWLFLLAYHFIVAWRHGGRNR